MRDEEAIQRFVDAFNAGEIDRQLEVAIESSVDFYTAWTVRDDLVARMDIFAGRSQAREFARSRSRGS